MFELILKQNKIESKMVPYPATGGLITAIMGDTWIGCHYPSRRPSPTIDPAT